PPQRLGPRPVVPEVPVLQVHPHRGQRLRHEPHFHARRPPRVRLRLPFRRDAPPQHDPLRHAAREHPAPRSLHAGRVPLEPPPPGPRLEHHRRQPALGPGVLRRPPRPDPARERVERPAGRNLQRPQVPDRRPPHRAHAAPRPRARRPTLPPPPTPVRLHTAAARRSRIIPTNRSNRTLASCGPGLASGWYCTANT